MNQDIKKYNDVSSNLDKHKQSLKDLIISSISNIMSVKKRQRLFNAEFGNSLDDFLFELQNPNVWSAIKSVIYKDLLEFEDRIEIKNINMFNEDNKVSIYIVTVIKETGEVVPIKL